MELLSTMEVLQTKLCVYVFERVKDKGISDWGRPLDIREGRMD